MKEICLGTAAWGWSVQKAEALSVLNAFYNAGGRYVDTARNYPINDDPNCFGLASGLLAAWVREHGVQDLKIVYKVGSISNRRIPDNDLSKSHLEFEYAWATEHFGANLYSLMVHWDRRSDVRSVRDTLEIIDCLDPDGIRFGLSGIDHPDVYAELLNDRGYRVPEVQVKHNFAESKIDSYDELRALEPRFWAYGIAAGGLKATGDHSPTSGYAALTGRTAYHESIAQSRLGKFINRIVRTNDVISNTYRLSMAFAEHTPQLFGYLVAPSTVPQTRDIFEFRKALAADTGEVLAGIDWQGMRQLRR